MKKNPARPMFRRALRAYMADQGQAVLKAYGTRRHARALAEFRAGVAQLVRRKARA